MLRFAAKASTLAFDSISSVGCVYTLPNISNGAVQISSTRQRKNVGDKSRFNRCILFLAQTLQSLRQGLYRGNMNYNLHQKSSSKAFLKKMWLIMPWDRKVSKTVRLLLDWQSKISSKYHWAESLFLSVQSLSGHMFNFLTHTGLIHITYIKFQ